MDVRTSQSPLHGPVAVVTGTTGGLGFAIAEEAAWAQAGCRIMLNGIQPHSRVEAMCGELESRTGVPVAYHEANVGDTSAVTGLVKTTLERFGAIDILVNNAVVRHFSPIVDFLPEHWDAALAVNLSAAFHAVRLALPQICAQAEFWTHLQHDVRYTARAGTINRVDYVTTKAALLGLTRAIALENLEYDVTCHGICPGSVLTPGTDDRVRQIMVEEDLSREAAERAFLEEANSQAAAIIPARNDVSELIVFLCGPVARDMTRSNLTGRRRDGSPAEDTDLSTTYDLFAIRYGHHHSTASHNFIGGDPHDGPMPLDYFVWAIVGQKRNFVFDTGFDAARAAKRQRTLLRPVGDGLRMIGLDPDFQVEDVILSHMHLRSCGQSHLVSETRAITCRILK